MTSSRASPHSASISLPHALTVSGQKYAFQGESLGVEVLVRMESRSLADYDYIFYDRAKRDKLIACLDIFIEVGWPNALRFLYRLPDSLRREMGLCRETSLPMQTCRQVWEWRAGHYIVHRCRQP